MQTLHRLIRETGGTSNAEYALMMAIVGTAVLMSAIWFGGACLAALSTKRVRASKRSGLDLRRALRFTERSDYPATRA